MIKFADHITVGGAVIPLPMTTAERDGSALLAGSIIWNKDSKYHEIFDGYYWIRLSKIAWLRRSSNGGSDNTINLNLVDNNDLVLNGVPFGEPGKYLEAVGTTAIRTLYDGFVKLSYQKPLKSTGIRPSILSCITRQRGSVFEEFAHDYCYVRGATGHYQDTNNGCDKLDCQAGDIFRIRYRRAGTSAAAVNLVNHANFLAEMV